MTTHHPDTRRLVYGHAQMHDCLAFADADTAAEEAAEIKALAAARTWGEARQVRMTHLWNPAGPEYYDAEDESADDQPFDINEVGAVVEGDWPSAGSCRGSRPDGVRARRDSSFPRPYDPRLVGEHDGLDAVPQVELA